MNPHYQRFTNNGGGGGSYSMPGNPRQRGSDMTDTGRVLGGASRMSQLNPNQQTNSSMGPNPSIGGASGNAKKFDNSPTQRYLLYVSRMSNNYFEPKSQNLLKNLGTLAHEFRYICVQDIPKSSRPPGLKMTPAIYDTLNGNLFQGTDAINYVSRLKQSEIQPVQMNIGTTICKFGFNCFPAVKSFGKVGDGMGMCESAGGPEGIPGACGNFNGGLGLGMDNFQSRIDGETDVRYKSERSVSMEDAATYRQFRNDLDGRYEQQRRQTGGGGALPPELRAYDDSIKKRNE